jgi:hypothetical protein
VPVAATHSETPDVVSYNGLEAIGHAAERRVIRIRVQTEGRGAKGLGVLGGGEVTIIDADELVQNEEGDLVEVGLEERMNVHEESILRPAPLGQGTGKFPGPERAGIENDFARVADQRALLEEGEQFLPSNPAAVPVVDFVALGCGVVRDGLPGVFARGVAVHGEQGFRV